METVLETSPPRLNDIRSGPGYFQCLERMLCVSFLFHEFLNGFVS